MVERTRKALSEKSTRITFNNLRLFTVIDLKCSEKSDHEMEQRMSKKAPTWTIVYMGILTILTLSFTVMSYINPSFLLSDWEALAAVGSLSLVGPMGLFLARNLATAVATGFAAFNRSVPMLKMAFLLRAIEDGMDAIHNVIEGSMGGALFGLVFCLVELFGLYTLFKLEE